MTLRTQHLVTMRKPIQDDRNDAEASDTDRPTSDPKMVFEETHAAYNVPDSPASDLIESVTQRLRAILSRLDASQLALLSQRDDWGLMAGLADPEVLSSARPSALDRALARGREFKARLIEQHETFSLEEAAQHKQVKPESLQRRIARGTLIGVRVGGELRLPAFQFEADSPNGELHGLSEVLSVMQLDSPWMRFAWFVSPQERLRGDSPTQALREGRKSAVIMAARGLGMQGGA